MISAFKPCCIVIYNALFSLYYMTWRKTSFHWLPDWLIIGRSRDSFDLKWAVWKSMCKSGLLLWYAYLEKSLSRVKRHHDIFGPCKGLSITSQISSFTWPENQDRCQKEWLVLYIRYVTFQFYLQRNLGNCKKPVITRSTVDDYRRCTAYLLSDCPTRSWLSSLHVSALELQTACSGLDGPGQWTHSFTRRPV